MNARERIIKALNHEVPDRVSLFCQVLIPEFQKNLLNYWGEIFLFVVQIELPNIKDLPFY
ncbi:MAG: hypothetical protein ACTSPN_04795 [Promethearchaeota archaeon]